jgi:hypothetical protein
LRSRQEPGHTGLRMLFPAIRRGTRFADVISALTTYRSANYRIFDLSYPILNQEPVTRDDVASAANHTVSLTIRCFPLPEMRAPRLTSLRKSIFGNRTIICRVAPEFSPRSSAVPSVTHASALSHDIVLRKHMQHRRIHLNLRVKRTELDSSVLLKFTSFRTRAHEGRFFHDVRRIRKILLNNWGRTFYPCAVPH